MMIPEAGPRPLWVGQQKTDVVEHPCEFNHVGLLVNEPPHQDGDALRLVFRQRRSKRGDGTGFVMLSYFIVGFCEDITSRL